MEIRKGPYGHFVIERIEDMGSIHEYTREIIAENIPGHMLPLYIIPTVNCYESSYDFSGLKPIRILVPEGLEQINRLRAALGDLLLTLTSLPDLLLSPSQVILDEQYIFTDEKYTEFKVCVRPYKTDPSKLGISSLSGTGLTSFLKSQIISSLLSPEEVDGIIYAVEENDSDLLAKQSELISQPLTEPVKENVLFKMIEAKMTILLCLVSLILVLLKIHSLSMLALFGSICFMVKTKKIIDDKPEIEVGKGTESKKKDMLFGDFNETTGGLDSIILTNIDPDSGEEERLSIYTDTAAIGSDRFLCDIYSPDKEMSPIHAQIKKTGRSYYVTDVSVNNMTFLDNVRLDPKHDYEIKNGQTLMCGRREFKIEIM
ncbi:MAG: FHA domain-containing protein [Clostridiales bacterium]|nr:FHA domain-containing protein [Clostridiales bacterium]